MLVDYLGVVTGKVEDKIGIAALKLQPASYLKTPLLADCPVNVECLVEQELDLDSHSLFIGKVLAVHAENYLLDEHGDVDLDLAQGLIYGCGVVREKPVGKFRVEDLRRRVEGRNWNRSPDK